MSRPKLSAQSNKVFLLTHQVETLTEALQSLEKAFSAKEASMQKRQKTNQALSKLITKKSEKIIPIPSADEPVGNRKKKAPSPKERGNNNARRKEYFDLEIQEHDIYPSCPGFQPEFGEFLKIVDPSATNISLPVSSNILTTSIIAGTWEIL